jgi:transmembrane sensor
MNGGLERTREDARREAAAWHVRLASGRARERDWLAFENWLISTENRAAYDQIEAALLEIEANRDAIASRLEEGARRIVPFPGQKRKFSAIWASVAAAALVIAFVGVKMLSTPAQAPTEQRVAYAAPADAARQVTLPDATIVNLNRGAAIDAHFTRDSRRVVLVAGEASFVVTHDASHPFVVEAGDGRIADVGTEFDVLSHIGALTVTVREGVVDVMTARVSRTRVERGQQLRVGAGAGDAFLASVNPDDAFAWQEDISRYSRVPVRIGDAQIAALRFSGVLAIDKPEAMISRLEGFLPVRFTQDENGIILRSR